MAKGGGLRQRFVNLMYLVFISMTALYALGDEVLNAFGTLNESISNNVSQSLDNNELFYANLKDKAEKSEEKYGLLLEDSKKLKESSGKIISYLNNVESDLRGIAGVDKNATAIEMKSTDATNNYFFSLGENVNNEEVFVENIETYKSEIIALIEKNKEEKLLSNSVSASLVKQVNSKFNTENIDKGSGVTQSWVSYNFENYPLIAAVANLNNFKSNVRNIESEILRSLVQGKLEAELDISGQESFIIADQANYVAGSRITGKIGVGGYSYEVNRVEIDGIGVVPHNDQGELSFPAGSAGKKDITGKVYFTGADGKESSIDLKSSFFVVNPSSSIATTVSATKMNVLYRAVDNPIEVSMSGATNIRASMSGGSLTKSGNGYIARVNAGKQATITVTGVNQDGKTVTSSPKVFRIKDIPPPMGLIQRQSSISLPTSALVNQRITAEILEFPFDLKFKVNSFTVKTPGKPTMKVNGDRFDGRAKNAILRLKRDDQVTISNIKVSIIGAGGYKVKRISPIVVTIR